MKCKRIALKTIGWIYDVQGNYSEALHWCEKALQIATQLGDLRKEATRLNDIGGFISNFFSNLF
ncbi:MAG: tetratricopeptide repeat protein [Promethearchaeota archaeon]